MTIKTSSDLKFHYETKFPNSLFFSHGNMKFEGDTMKNFGVRQPVGITDVFGNKVVCYELFRRRPVKAGNQRSFWFEVKTLNLIHKTLSQ